MLKESYIHQLLAQWTYDLNQKFKYAVKVIVDFRSLFDNFIFFCIGSGTLYVFKKSRFALQ